MNKYLSVIILFLNFGVVGCIGESKNLSGSGLIIGRTVSILNHQQLKNDSPDVSLIMDSVLNDSRCPGDVECFWQGNAAVKFKFIAGDQTADFVLNTGIHPMDTVLNGFKITLSSLLPVRLSTHVILPSEYRAQVELVKN